MAWRHSGCYQYRLKRRSWLGMVAETLSTSAAPTAWAFQRCSKCCTLTSFSTPVTAVFIKAKLPKLHRSVETIPIRSQRSDRGRRYQTDTNPLLPDHFKLPPSFPRTSSMFLLWFLFSAWCFYSAFGTPEAKTFSHTWT